MSAIKILIKPTAEMNINPETVLVAKNDTLITPDVTLTNQDTVTILSVISGG